MKTDYTRVLHSFVDFLNNNKFLAGIAMIMFSIGSRYIVIDMSKNTETLLKTKIMRRLTLFSIFFVGTRDIYVSLVLTAVFLVMTMGLFNEESSYCIIPKSFGDNVFTPEEYAMSKRIIQEYEKINKIQE
jgi:di/tricarboxylate transporter